MAKKDKFKLSEFFSLDSAEVKIIVIVLMTIAGFAVGFLLWLRQAIESIGM